ncbi:ABC transporter permease [Candidatus Sumerlaeota bacterium]|nr:ABC transporter permease [Candidatus Sumerlaeales bacterium]NLD62202.1 ABC transporter permease [Candidatus Sumerlaeota bacterium]
MDTAQKDNTRISESAAGTSAAAFSRIDIELTWGLALRDIRVRYRRSIGGFLWSFARPIFLTIVLWAVFSHILRIPFNHPDVPYWLFMLTSILGWNFVTGTLIEGTYSVCGNSNLVRKVPVNAAVFPISVLLSNAFHFALALIVLFLVLIIGGWFTASWWLILLPFVIITQGLFVLALAMFTSSMQVYYRDIGNGLDIITMAWFYITPILYPLDLAHAELAARFGPWAWCAYLSNPTAVFAAATRRCLIFGPNAEIHDATLLMAFSATTLASIVLLMIGWKVFHKLSERFADEL